MMIKKSLNTQSLFLGQYEDAVHASIANLAKEHFGERLWQGDSSLWTADPREQKSIRNALGWLNVTETMQAKIDGIDAFVREVRDAGFTHALLMGMGGSSLAPLVFQHSFNQGKDGLVLLVLDTTDPATILHIEKSIPLLHTLFIIASKSGTTAEPSAFGDYFYKKVKTAKGKKAGENFAAITDPSTPLARLAEERGFRQIFFNFAEIGGRYSALSYFGLLPAAILGVPIRALLEGACQMGCACAPTVPTAENPGIVLGAAIGELACRECDKLTFLIPESIAPLGMWLEQLIAESTGKDGTGVLPVAGEPAGSPKDYSEDRFFVYMRSALNLDERLEELAEALKEQGRPLAVIEIADHLKIGEEFFRWEIATATAGRILGINPFDQPNVQESKESTNRLLAIVKEKGQLPEPKPVLTEGPLRFYGQHKAVSGRELFDRFFATMQRHDYIALQAYLTETGTINDLLQDLRIMLRETTGLAVTLGYGPRLLHSTGQFHKGGTNNGLFLQLTADNPEDMAIPGTTYTFGTFKQAQAMGDMESLLKHGRRIIRVHLGADAEKGLAALHGLFKASLPALGLR